MHINVETRPVSSTTYDSRKKRVIETIDRLYHREARASMQKVIARLHPADMAAILDELPPEHAVDIFLAMTDKEMSAEVFSQFSSDMRTQVMAGAPIAELAGVLEHLPPDELADLIGDLPERQQAELMSVLGGDSKSEVEKLLK